MRSGGDLLFCIFCCLLGCGGPLHVAPVFPQGAPPRFEARRCTESIAGLSVDCGTLVVPENRKRSPTREVRIPVAILHGRNATPDEVPALFLPGGPGEPSLSGLSRIAAEAAPVLEQRDLLLFDYRGVGSSAPSLSCDQANLDPQDRSFLARCRDSLLARDIDLDAYRTADVAADIADLVVTLGHRKVDLIGNSYGTRVALTLMRDHSNLVRRAVLDAPVPLEVNLFETVPAAADRAFEALFQSCQDDPGCASAHPDLEREFDRVLASLKAHPVDLVLGARGEQEVKVRLTPAIFTNVLVQCFGVPLLPTMPAVIGDAAKGRFGAVVTLLQILERRPPAIRMLGAYQSVQCSEEMPFNTLGGARATMAQHPRFAELSTYDRQARSCSQWRRAPLDLRESQRVTSSAPMLLLNGNFDPIVDPAWAEATRAGLPNAKHVVFPSAAHGTLHLECGWKVAASYLVDPEAGLDDCLAEQRAPRFVMDDAASSVARAVQGLQLSDPGGS
jgi:pimeloyl-ACP methyl ester carboxylesterase